jgi:hypothetical protein
MGIRDWGLGIRDWGLGDYGRKKKEERRRLATDLGFLTDVTDELFVFLPSHQSPVTCHLSKILSPQSMMRKT